MSDRVESFARRFEALTNEVARVVVGQEDLVRQVLTGLVAGGHVLLEGVPGLGKTLLVKTLGSALKLEFSRIQFTPDLMPADISGTTMVEETPQGRSFRFAPGPVFSNLVLADEINRATPRTQSALLEAMQERHVTVGDTSHPLPQPFFVMATQNPIEMEGTYPLPEAQVDRFLFKLRVPFPNLKELSAILERTTGEITPTATAALSREELLDMQSLAREVVAAEPVREYAARLVLGTHPEQAESPPELRQNIRFGASPRGAQSLLLAGKVRALTQGRFNLAFEDIQSVAHAALRHRIILSFEGEARGTDPDEIVTGLLKAITPPVGLT